MARDTTDDTPLSSKDELVNYLADGCKPPEQFRIGTEHEKFAFFIGDNTPVPYEGQKSIATLLTGMRDLLGWEPILDEGNIIGLVEPTGNGAISLEPGGQFELSGAAVDNIHQTCRESKCPSGAVARDRRTARDRVSSVSAASPKWTRAETPRMPKQRYDIMTAYMPKVGNQGLDMMYRTCTIQVNLDFSSEADMRRKMQVSLKLQSLATALFALSPFTEGRPNGLLSWRSDIWRDTDPDRTGILPFAFAPDFGFEDYVDWALDIPMYFILQRWPLSRLHPRHVPPVHGWRAQRRSPGRLRDDGRLDQSFVDAVSRSAVEALPGNARRRWRPVAGASVLCLPSGSACFTTTMPLMPLSN